MKSEKLCVKPLRRLAELCLKTWLLNHHLNLLWMQDIEGVGSNLYLKVWMTQVKMLLLRISYGSKE